MLGGAGGLLERRERQACVNVIEWEHFIAQYIGQLTRDSEQCWQRVTGPNRVSHKHPHCVILSLGEVLIQLVDYH